jgi:hypothetical protein
MARTVVALYDNFSDANDAVRDLVDNGFSRSDVSIMASDVSGEYGTYLADDYTAVDTTADATASGAGAGAGIGAIIGGLGGLLVGLGALTIPGIGPVIAAGPLAAALSGLAGAGVGAVAGGVTGGLIGALLDLGVPEEEAQYYTEGVRRGGTVVTVRAEDHRAELARDLMNRHDPVDMNERVSSWRERGWTGFDPSAEPYSAEEYELERARYGTMADTDYMAGYDTYNNAFQRHYQTSLANTGYPYDYYEPAYRFGYERATSRMYTDRDWDDVEPEFRRDWESRNPGSWEQFKASVRHAWEEVKDAFD